MTDLFELNHNCQSDLDLESVEDQKEDEKLAIQSIYGDDALCESIPGKLWEIRLQLPQLEGLLLQQIQKSSMNSKSKAKSGPTLKELQQDSNVCQWFLRLVNNKINRTLKYFLNLICISEGIANLVGGVIRNM